MFDFPGGNTAIFSNNSSTSNTWLGYNILSGTPIDGVGTNTGFGNGTNTGFGNVGGGDNF